MTILDIEDILYTGTKEDIKKVLTEYKVSYSYSEKTKNLEIKSLKLNTISRGYNSSEIPNCVKYFGNNYNN